LKNSKLYWRVDNAIIARELRVIAADGKQLGIMTKEKALAAAKKEGLSLVEIAPTAKPPVAKIVDFGKFRYQEEKKLRKQLKGAKGGELKEIRLSPFIAENDFCVRFDRISEFLGEKNKVKVVVVFRGREMGSKQFGYAILDRIVKDLGENKVAIDMKPKFFGRHLIMIISPRVGIKKEEPKDAKNENQKIHS
jgi:translation initiation factor IF-3